MSRFRLWFPTGAAIAFTAACGSDGGPTPPADNTPDTTPAALVVVSGGGQSAAPGTALAQPLVVRVDNASSQPLANVTVTWSVLSGGGTLSTTSTTTGTDGRTQVTYTLGPAAGANQIRAAVAGAAGLTATFTATAAVPNTTPGSIEIVSGNNQTATVGTALAQPLVVRVRNTDAQPLANAVVAWSVTQGGGTLGAPTSTTDAQGQASNTYTVGGSPGAQQVTAAVQDNTSVNVVFSATAEAPPSQASVSVEDFLFDPDAVTIAAGGQVTWTWNGNTDHTLTWVSGGFTDVAAQTTGTHTVTFATPGTYDYYCQIHGTPTTGMRGSVTVK